MITLSEQTKKILFAAFFVVFSIGTGYALYYFFFRPVVVPVSTETPQDQYGGELGAAGQRGQVTSTTPGGEGTLPTAGTTAGTTGAQTATAPTDVSLLRDSVTQATSMGPDGSTRFYDPATGKFYRVNPDGSITELSARQFYNVEQISWGNTQNEAILQFPDGSNIYYDFDNQRQTTLPAHWEDFHFAPNSSDVVAKSMGLDQDNKFLITAKADGTEQTALYHMGDNADLVTPSWSPNNQVVGFSQTGDPQPDNGQAVVLLGKNHEEFKSLKVPGRGFQPLWSPSGKQLLYSAYHDRDQMKPMLWVSDASGDDINNNRRRLNLNTWADKCAWQDEKTLICGVPQYLPMGAGLDESSADGIPHDVYLVDLISGISKKISSDDQTHALRKPILSTDGTKLTFTDAVTGKLYSYTLHR